MENSKKIYGSYLKSLDTYFPISKITSFFIAMMMKK